MRFSLGLAPLWGLSEATCFLKGFLFHLFLLLRFSLFGLCCYLHILFNNSLFQAKYSYTIHSIGYQGICKDFFVLLECILKGWPEILKSRAPCHFVQFVKFFSAHIVFIVLLVFLALNRIFPHFEVHSHIRTVTWCYRFNNQRSTRSVSPASRASSSGPASMGFRTRHHLFTNMFGYILVLFICGDWCFFCDSAFFNAMCFSMG